MWVIIKFGRKREIFRLEHDDAANEGDPQSRTPCGGEA